MGVEVLRSALTALVERLAPVVGHVRTLAIPLRDDDTPDPDALEVFRSGQMSAVSALRLAKAALASDDPEMIATAYVAAESYVKHAMALQAGRLSDAQRESEYRQIQELSQRVENLGRALDDERKAALERRRRGGLKTGALQRHAAREVRLRVWTRYQEELLAENKKSLAERKKRQEARRIVAHETGLTEDYLRKLVKAGNPAIS